MRKKICANDGTDNVSDHKLETKISTSGNGYDDDRGPFGALPVALSASRCADYFATRAQGLEIVAFLSCSGIMGQDHGTGSAIPHR